MLRFEDGWFAGVRDVASYLRRIADTTATTTGRGRAASSAMLLAHLHQPPSPAPEETTADEPTPAPPRAARNQQRGRTGRSCPAPLSSGPPKSIVSCAKSAGAGAAVRRPAVRPPSASSARPSIPWAGATAHPIRRAGHASTPPWASWRLRSLQVTAVQACGINERLGRDVTRRRSGRVTGPVPVTNRCRESTSRRKVSDSLTGLRHARGLRQRKARTRSGPSPCPGSFLPAAAVRGPASALRGEGGAVPARTRRKHLSPATVPPDLSNSRRRQYR
ncbi:hypothetical protein GA0115239_12213 [Streptomyces sp. BpilaLS-43]|nr:hypothetical protein GA0115239_12213 [Streptomyces sp. BpilaLS-43]